jgi:hypothetical protein
MSFYQARIEQQTAKNHFGKAYVNGNVVEGKEGDGTTGTAACSQRYRRCAVADVLPKIKVNEPFKHAP